MANIQLFACPSCARHVRVTESNCPFCGSALADEFRSQTRLTNRAPGTRLSRAAMYAAGAGAIAVTAACTVTSASTSDGGTSTDASADASKADSGQNSSVVAMYGMPADIDAGDSSVAPMYGLPADAGADAKDSSPPGVDAAYGGPPIDSGPDADNDSGFQTMYGGPPTSDSGT